MHLYPAIDLRGGKVVRLLQGDYDKQTTYGEDPVSVAREFADAGCTWLHMVDLDGAREGKLTQLKQIGQICRETHLRVQVGGGVRTSAAIDALFSVGVDRVILGTAALENWEWFEGLMGNPTYTHRLILGLDARDGKLAVSGWEQATDQDAFQVAKRVSDWPLAGIVYTDIAMDGTLKGPNLEAMRKMAESTLVPVIASGGVGTMDHLRLLSRLPLQGVIVGRAIYEKTVDVGGALKLLHGKGRKVR